MRTHIAPLALAAALLISCGGQSVPFRQPARATTLHLDESDDEILRIALNARNTLNVFFRHLNTPDAGERNFSVKYALPVDGGGDVDVEQIWIGNIGFRDGGFYGTVASTPVYLTSLGRGDRVGFSAEAVTDWMFTRNGRIVGGYSIRYLLERIPEEERSDGQRRTLLMFD